MGFRACPACARHVRADAASCPFCQTALPFAAERLKRLALGGAMLMAAAGTPGCAAVSQASPVYGAPAPDPTPSVAASPPVAQPLYGALAPSQAPQPSEPPAPVYGGPPPFSP